MKPPGLPSWFSQDQLGVVKFPATPDPELYWTFLHLRPLSIVTLRMSDAQIFISTLANHAQIYRNFPEESLDYVRGGARFI